MGKLLPEQDREALDSAFLAKYARGIERRRWWVVVWHVLVGGVSGYGLGVMVITLKDMYDQLAGGMNWLAQLSGRMPVLSEDVFYWGYLPYLLAAIGVVLWGARGMGRSEEMRFKAQMALHVLKLQEMMDANNSKG